MKLSPIVPGLCGVTMLFYIWVTAGAQTKMDSALTPKFELKTSGLLLERRTQAGTFFDVVGHKSAVLGYEHRSLETWVYPMKIFDDFELSFRIEGYPLEFRAADLAVKIDVRPEATTFTYSHAAFTVRQIIFAPIDEPGVIMLLDVKTVLPMTITASFKPRLKLAWPAGLMTANLHWDKDQHLYYLTEESRRFVGVVGSPGARDISAMPYQEEPRDVPTRFVIEPATESLKSHLIPIVIAGSVSGRAEAKATYDRLLGSVQTLYEKNVAYYRRLLNETAGIKTPDKRLDEAFQWAKIGIDKGVATNPLLGAGLLAGFRTSGESERPGFAWFFGRDALWTSFAINSYGDFATTRTALEFLKKFQRADGKIPHEISQSASLIPWFSDYEYPWASSDATPLYVIAQADYWRATGDKPFLKANWDSIVRAYRWSAASDTDGNHLIENSTGTRFGHGWVEDGPLTPPHEEIYMQGLWIEASRNLAEMANQIGDNKLAQTAGENADRTRATMEKTYWLERRGFYAFATKQPTTETPKAEPGPNRATRQARMEELAKATIVDEDTVLPAVPLWWRTMNDDRAQSEIDHLGSGRIATDWGARIISNDSKLYDPLSYHNGSVWPLFTGWASMAAYQYGRPQVGYQALMSNALLTYTSALGYVTELLSGDFNAPFGRSSHHQVWSEAMVVTPIMRGLFGIEVNAEKNEIRFAPQLPANWDYAEARNVAAGAEKVDLAFARSSGRLTITIKPSSPNQTKSSANTHFVVAPAFPLDAHIRNVTVQGRDSKFDVARVGDIQRAEVILQSNQSAVEIVFNYGEGSDVYIGREIPVPGSQNQGLRILHSRAGKDALQLVLEGLGGRTYGLRIRTPHQLIETSGVKIRRDGNSDPELIVEFDGSPDTYSRRTVIIPFRDK
jgi:glycogen debranching enzyme